jgi:hypothetical protein
LPSCVPFDVAISDSPTCSFCLPRKFDRYFSDLVGCPVGAVGFTVPPVSVIRGAEGSGLLFTGPIVPGGAGLSIS